MSAVDPTPELMTEAPADLAAELEYYNRNLKDWLRRYPGRVVLVKGDELVGVFDDEDEALVEGARRFGLTSFLIRRVLPQQAEIRIPAMTLGVLRANP
jgi:hypothetical protein